MNKLLLFILPLLITSVYAFPFTELNKGISNQVCMANQIIQQINNSNCTDVLKSIVSEFKAINLSNGTIQEYQDVYATAKNLTYQFREALHLFLSNETIKNLKVNPCYSYNLKYDYINYAFPNDLAKLINLNDPYHVVYSYVLSHGNFKILPIPKAHVLHLAQVSQDKITLIKLEREGKVISIRQYIAEKLKEK